MDGPVDWRSKNLGSDGFFTRPRLLFASMKALRTPTPQPVNIDMTCCFCDNLPC
jgi:hypothetical protein